MGNQGVKSQPALELVTPKTHWALDAAFLETRGKPEVRFSSILDFRPGNTCCVFSPGGCLFIRKEMTQPEGRLASDAASTVAGSLGLGLGQAWPS